MPTKRLRVLDPYVIKHVMAHPARGRAWSVRELAQVVGASPSLIGHLRSGERQTVDAETAQLVSLAVGCEVAVLFDASPSTKFDNNESIAEAS